MKKRVGRGGVEQGVDQILHLIYLLINFFGFSARQDILISDLPAGEAAAERNEVHETHPGQSFATRDWRFILGPPIPGQRRLVPMPQD